MCLQIIALSSCKEDEEKVYSLELAVNAIPNVAAEGDTKSFYITCSSNWKVVSNQAWCVVAPAAGTGNASVTVMVQPTNAPTTRTAIITVSSGNLSGEIRVTQAGTVLGVSTTDITNVPAAGTVTSFDITSNTNWTATSDKAWCKLVPASGTGDGTVIVTVDPTDEITERTAYISVMATGGHTEIITLTQERLMVTLSTNSIEAEAAGTITDVTITTNTPWTVVSNRSWCQVSPASGTGNDNLTVTVSPTDEITARSATITVTAGPLTGTIIVNQKRTYNRLSDSLTLVCLYDALGMANFAATAKWDLTAPLPATGTSTSWPGIRVNAQGRVDSLYFASGCIPATVTNAYLPDCIGDLKELRGFILNASATSGKLNGTIPESFWTLTKLTRLSLTTHGTYLSGPISSGIGNLTEMINISLLNTSGINGALPSTIGNLTKLTDINLSGTGITSLPVELKNCVSMVNFMCTGTQISSLPEVFDSWPNVGMIQLSGNTQLTGSLPSSIGTINSTRSVSVHLQQCNFTGTIPASWGNITATFSQFRFQDNKLSGEIPAGLKANSQWPAWFNTGTPAGTGAYICPQQSGFSFTNCSL